MLSPGNVTQIKRQQSGRQRATAPTIPTNKGIGKCLLNATEVKTDSIRTGTVNVAKETKPETRMDDETDMEMGIVREISLELDTKSSMNIGLYVA